MDAGAGAPAGKGPVLMTDWGGHAELLDGLPDDLPALVGVVQGLLLHEHLAGAYRVTLDEARRRSSHLRPVSAILRQVLAADPRPLREARAPERRTVGVCRHFALLLAALLQAKGVPARTRCGFGDWFAPEMKVDHWVCEAWGTDEGRWRLVDPQLDEVQRTLFGIDFDPLDVPRDRFLVAGEAWCRCRWGEADPDRFGIFDLRGPWFIAGNLVRDVAALNGMPMLPWDCWGAMPEPGEAIPEAGLALFDRLAALTCGPEPDMAALADAYDDERLRVPAVVFNAVAGCREAA